LIPTEKGEDWSLHLAKPSTMGFAGIRPMPNSTSAQALNQALKPTALGFTLHNRVIRKVRKTQHRNPEFGQHRVKRFIGIQGGFI